MSESIIDSCNQKELPDFAEGEAGVDCSLRRPRSTSLLMGVLVGFTSNGEPLVLFEGSPMRSSVVARSCIYLERGFVGRDVILHLEDSDSCRPVILGSIIPSPLRRGSSADANVKCLPPEHVELDGERVILSAAREIVLQCGEASLTMTRAGKIVLRGSHVASRATGVVAIKGGSVEIN